MTTTVQDLTHSEMEAILGRNNVGRIAFTDGRRVDIEPIGYVYFDGAIYGRAAPGTRMTALRGHPWVAFEVDEVHSFAEWKSVVAKGTVYLVEPIDRMPMREQYAHALQVLRSVMPEALTADDPVPSRAILFRLHIDEMEGRTARPDE